VIGMESPRGIADPSLGAFGEMLAQADGVLLLGKRLDFTLRFGSFALGGIGTATFGAIALARIPLLAVLLVLAGAAVGRYTRLARWTYAIGNNEQIALGNGIPVARVKVINFVGAAGCSAFAGVLASIQIGAGSATVGVGSLFLTIAAVVIGGTALSGGKGGILRSALGVLLLTTLNNGLILSGVSPNIQSGVSGVVLIAAIIAAAWPYRGRLRVSK